MGYPVHVSFVISLALHLMTPIALGLLWNFHFEDEEVAQIEETILVVDSPKPPQDPMLVNRKMVLDPPRLAQEATSEITKQKAAPKLRKPKRNSRPATDPEPAAPRRGLKLDVKSDVETKVTSIGHEVAAQKRGFKTRARSTERGTEALAKYSPRVRRAVFRNSSFIGSGAKAVSGRLRRVFHNYLVQIHETEIHPVFAETYLKSLNDLPPRDPLNNWHLRAFTEFEIRRDGTVGEVRVVFPSGNLAFDAAAVDAVLRASPFPKPPREILSYNDRVYMKWGFFRNSRRCGVFNSESYVLDKPNTYATFKMKK